MSESKAYKAKLNKKVKDMTPAEKREYTRLRVKDSRAKKKAQTSGVKVGKDGSNSGNIPNSKLKCWIRKNAKTGGMYKTCAVPEKDRKPKKQVRGKPAKRPPAKKPIMRAYATDEARKKAQQNRAKKDRADKNPNRIPATKADGTVVPLKIKKKGKKKPSNPFKNRKKDNSSY